MTKAPDVLSDTITSSLSNLVYGSKSLSNQDVTFAHCGSLAERLCISPSLVTMASQTGTTRHSEQLQRSPIRIVGA